MHVLFPLLHKITVMTVGVVTKLWARGSGVWFPAENRFNCSSERLLFNEWRNFCHEADRSPPSNAEYKNEWSYTSIPLYAFQLQRPEGS
jgi:hypothetical protein